MPRVAVGGLEVAAPNGNGGWRLLPPSDTMARDAHTIIDRALLIAESPRGMQSLTKLAQEILDSLRGSTLYDIRRDPNLRNVSRVVELFLRRLRSDFPRVFIGPTRGEASTVRHNWANSSSDTEFDMYPPKRAVDMYLSKLIMEDLARTTNNRDRTVYMFQMIISVAHKLCHVLTNFLVGRKIPGTPNDLAVPGTGPESGFVWEVRTMGGIVEFYSDPRYGNEVHQTGIPYLFADGRRTTPGGEVRDNFIVNLGHAQFPIQSWTQNARSRAELEASGSRAMADIRWDHYTPAEQTMVTGYRPVVTPRYLPPAQHWH